MTHSADSSMSTILATSAAFGAHALTQAAIKRRVVAWLGSAAGSRRRVVDTFDTGLVKTRSTVVPLSRVFSPRSFEENNDAYIHHSVELGTRAVRSALRKARLRAADVDYFVSSSCTGFAIPSIDALIAHRIGMRPSVARLPITQHGCAGGAVALREAASHLHAHPRATALVLAVELPSLTFQHRDHSPENIVSAGLFGDGAAAAVLRAGSVPGRPAIVATGSRLFPESAGLMGFRLTNTGLKIVLSRRVPSAIREHAVPALEEFLAAEGSGFDSVDHWLLHPGGRKIIESFEDVLGLGEGGLRLTRDVLAAHGNLSSATILVILDACIRRRVAEPGDTGVVVAFGPGFGSEMLLLKWPRAVRLRRGSSRRP